MCCSMAIEKEISKVVNFYKMMELKPNYSELSRIYGIDPRTIKKIYEEGVDNERHRNKESALDKYKDIIEEKMKIKGMKISSLYNYLCEEEGYIGKYNTLTNYIRKHGIAKPAKENGKIMYETAPGEQLQFDWVEDIKLVLKSGEVVTFNVFSAELAFSRMHYYIFSLTKTKEDVLLCLVKTFKYFNGVTKTTLTDNMSSIVHDGKFCNEIKELAKDFNFQLKKCKVRHSWTKGKVEVRNKFMKWLIPYNNELETIEDIIKIIKKINKKVNERINARINTKPILVYQKEKEYLQPLPSKEIINNYYNLMRPVKVSKLSTIYYKGCQYSVPEKFINKTLKIKESDNKLYIYDNTDLVRWHEINNNTINYNKNDYEELLSKIISNKSKNDIEALAKTSLEMFELFKK